MYHFSFSCRQIIQWHQWRAHHGEHWNGNCYCRSYHTRPMLYSTWKMPKASWILRHSIIEASSLRFLMDENVSQLILFSVFLIRFFLLLSLLPMVSWVMYSIPNVIPRAAENMSNIINMNFLFSLFHANDPNKQRNAHTRALAFASEKYHSDWLLFNTRDNCGRWWCY